MLSKLTEKQKAAMATHAQYWISRSLECRPTDHGIAVQGIRSYYRIAKLEEPKRIVWVPNPLVLVMAGPIATSLVEGGDVSNTVRDAVDVAVRGAVRGAVAGAVRGAVAGAVEDAVHDAVRGAVAGAVGGAVGGAVRVAVGGAVRVAVGGAVSGAVHIAVSGAVSGAVHIAVEDAVEVAVHDAVHDAVDGTSYLIQNNWAHYLGGMFWSAWPAAYGTFFRDHCGLDIAKEALQAAEDVTECGWWWPHKEFVMICERPERLKRNDRGDLHSLRGPAIAWPGFKLYFVNGRQVPEEWKHSLQEAELMQRLGT